METIERAANAEALGVSCSPASARTAHERIELDAAALEQRLVRARRRDEHARGAGCAKRADVAAREVDAVDLVKSVPGQVVAGVGTSRGADRRDRPLAARVEEGDRAALRRVAARRLDRDALLAELGFRAAGRTRRRRAQ